MALLAARPGEFQGLNGTDVCSLYVFECGVVLEAALSNGHSARM